VHSEIVGVCVLAGDVTWQKKAPGLCRSAHKEAFVRAGCWGMCVIRRLHWERNKVIFGDVAALTCPSPCQD
jgi:hypothetical protein